MGAWSTVATITVRSRAVGTKSYRAAIRLKRKVEIVYLESRTFDRKALAKDWAPSQEFVAHVMGWLRTGTPQTASNNLIWIRSA